MNSKNFLVWGGIVLVVVGILGFFLIGPTSEGSIFGASWWFDNAENWAHLIIGIVALIAAFALPSGAQKGLVWVVGIIAVLIGLYSLFGGEQFLGANLERVWDTILHLVVGIWAIWAARKTGGTMSAPSSGPGMGGGM